MQKQREEDNAKVKESQNKGYRLCLRKKHRDVISKSDRLREFREATKYTAVFLCTCCHQRMFHSNVQLYTAELINNINSKKPGLVDACIQKRIITQINGEMKTYICKTCIKHMNNKKIPPMSAMNGLQLHETDEMIDSEGLNLTELEGALIAKTIIFQKIYQMPKSRWTALKDRLINIPLNDDDILNTLEQMPRTPRDAGLIGVSLKRKKEYKNSHKQQLINPKK